MSLSIYPYLNFIFTDLIRLIFFSGVSWKELIFRRRGLGIVGGLGRRGGEERKGGEWGSEGEEEGMG